MLFIDYSQHHRFDRSARLAKQGETHSPPAISKLSSVLFCKKHPMRLLFIGNAVSSYAFTVARIASAPPDGSATQYI